MSTKKLREIGRRLIEAKAGSNMASKRYAAAREETASALLQANRKHGVIKTAVELPGLGEVATITLKKGSVSVVVDENALLETCTEHFSSEIEDVIAPDALTDPKVIEAVRQVRPDAVAPQVREVWRAAKIEEARKSRGHIVIPKTGEHIKIAEVVPHAPSGEFQLSFTDDGRNFIDAFAGAVAGQE